MGTGRAERERAGRRWAPAPRPREEIAMAQAASARVRTDLLIPTCTRGLFCTIRAGAGRLDVAKAEGPGQNRFRSRRRDEEGRSGDELRSCARCARSFRHDIRLEWIRSPQAGALRGPSAPWLFRPRPGGAAARRRDVSIGATSTPSRRVRGRDARHRPRRSARCQPHGQRHRLVPCRYSESSVVESSLLDAVDRRDLIVEASGSVEELRVLPAANRRRHRARSRSGTASAARPSRRARRRRSVLGQLEVVTFEIAARRR